VFRMDRTISVHVPKRVMYMQKPADGWVGKWKEAGGQGNTP